MRVGGGEEVGIQLEQGEGVLFEGGVEEVGVV